MNMASEVYEMNLEDENTKLKAEIEKLGHDVSVRDDYIKTLQAEIEELVDMLEGATNIITGKEVSPIIYNVAKATARIAKHRSE